MGNEYPYQSRLPKNSTMTMWCISTQANVTRYFEIITKFRFYCLDCTENRICHRIKSQATMVVLILNWNRLFHYLRAMMIIIFIIILTLQPSQVPFGLHWHHPAQERVKWKLDQEEPNLSIARVSCWFPFDKHQGEKIYSTISRILG